MLIEGYSSAFTKTFIEHLMSHGVEVIFLNVSIQPTTNMRSVGPEAGIKGRDK